MAFQGNDCIVQKLSRLDDSNDRRKIEHEAFFMMIIFMCCSVTCVRLEISTFLRSQNKKDL